MPHEERDVPQVVDLIGFVCTPIRKLLIIKALSVSIHINSMRLKLNLTTDVITVSKRECNLTTAVISRLSNRLNIVWLMTLCWHQITLVGS